MSSDPLICTAFDSSNTCLAFGVVSLDNHQVKVQSVVPSQLSINTSFNLDKSCKISNISWIPYKDEQIVAVSLTKGSTLIYSPLKNSILAELKLATNLSIADFHFSQYTQTGWSCDIGGNIFEWDINNYKLLQTFKVNEFLDDVESINKIITISYNNQPHLLLASHSIYLVEISTKSLIKTFPGHIQPINAIFPIPENDDLFLTSAQSDRFMNLYSLKKSSTKAVFVAQTPITNVCLSKKDSKSIIVSISENGCMEVFNDPFNDNNEIQNPLNNNSVNGSSKKKRRQQASSVKSFSSNSIITLSRPEIEIKSTYDANMTINAASINDDTIIFTWLENSNISCFESIKWLDESGNYLLEKNFTIHKSRPHFKSSQKLTENGHDIAAIKQYSEGHAIISDGTNVRDLDIDSENEDEETLAEKLDKISSDQTSKQTSKKSKKKLGGQNAATSLSIILSQSLRNSDHTLLETVLSNRDSHVIQNTIAKLDSSLAVILLDRLSEKIQRQSSRFNQLNYWLKWILIIHGAVLTSLPKLNNKLSNLHSVLIKKADTLPRLLELQGRLTLLYHQTELKREIVTDELDEISDDVDSDVEYNEYLDDAKLLENDLSDMEIGDHDDYAESDDGMVVEIDDVEEDEDEDDDEEVEQENYSDLEIED